MTCTNAARNVKSMRNQQKSRIQSFYLMDYAHDHRVYHQTIWLDWAQTILVTISILELGSYSEFASNIRATSLNPGTTIV